MPSCSNRPTSTSRCCLLLIISAALISLWFAACSGPDPSPTPTAASLGPPFDLHTALAGLAKFKSIYSEFGLEWRGSDNGLPVAGSLRFERLQSREADAQEVYATIAQDDSFWVVALVQIGQENWFYHQGEADNWQLVGNNSVDELLDQVLLTPEALFSLFELKVDSPSDSERVGNVQTNVYPISATDFSSESVFFRNAAGTATVSAEGGYLIELELTIEVDFLESGQLMDTGEIELSYRVPVTSSPLTVQLPALARQDIPLPADVTLQDPTPIPLSQRDQFIPPADSQLSFITKTDPLSVAELYHTQMPDHGWTALIFNIPVDTGPEIDPIQFRFVREDEGVAVKIAADQENTEVSLSFGERGTIEGNLCNGHAECDSLTWFNFPLAPDGDIRLIMSGGGFGQLVYTTGCKAELMQQFYAMVLPAEGWDPAQSADHVRYERGSEAAELIFAPLEDGRTSVEIQSSSPTLDIWGYPNKIDLQLSNEFPQVTDAQLFRLMPGQLAYRSQQNIDQIVEFYQQELSTAGWVAQSNPVSDSQATVLRYQKDEVTATLLAKTTENEVNLVWISLYRKKAGEP